MFYCSIYQVFPVFYAAMSNKTADPYEKLFTYIENNVFKLNPATFMADYETGLRKSINKCYVFAVLYGCWYHYKAAVRRNCSRTLYRLIAEHPIAGTIYRMLLNLPLLPSNNINDGYLIIKTIARSNNLFQKFKNLFEYFEGFWLQVVNKLYSFMFLIFK